EEDLKAPSFAYAKAKSLAEAFDLIERPGAKILAGGQSLIPSLNMRLAAPELLVDITGLKDLTVIDVRPGGLRIGALVTHGLFETDLRPGEIVAAAEFPKVNRSVFLELARRQGDYAIAGIAGVADASGKRIAFLGVGATPVFATHASRAISLNAALEVLGRDLDPPADLYHSSATKLHLAKVLLSRAWNTLSKPH